jgi:hypothetical protein
MEYQMWRTEDSTFVGQGTCDYEPTESMTSFTDWWESGGEDTLMSGVPTTGAQIRLVMHTPEGEVAHRHHFDW